jgi:hypothetical protein
MPWIRTTFGRNAVGEPPESLAGIGGSSIDGPILEATAGVDW